MTLTITRWTNLPISIARHATRGEESMDAAMRRALAILEDRR